MVINRVENSDQSPEDWVSDEDGSGGFTGLPGTPCFTSRLSLLKFGSVVAKFGDFKRQLVMETGFGGFLEVKAWQKINLKYSTFSMDRVHVESSTINLEEQGVLELSEQKLNYVFGIPSGEFDINGKGVEPSEACIEYTRMAASFIDKGTHSLKAAENVLLGAISESSSQIQQDCFKIAFVIFIIVHVLTPTSKHDYISIDFWAALNDISKIKSWNWGGYVLKHLFQAVRKFKTDVSKRNPTIHIVGCHLFLQVFVLDCLDLGILNKPQEITPHIGLYDYDSMRKMVENIAVNISPGEISYHGGAVIIVFLIIEVCGLASIPSTPMLWCNYTRTGPQDFSNYIRTKYPNISAEKLGILLHEQNARGLANITEMRQAFQTNMFTFTDKLMACLAESCTCCKAFGRKSCILNGEGTTNCQPHPTTSTDQNQFSTPLVSKVGPRLPAPCHHEGAMSATSTTSRKREGSISSSVHSGLAKKQCSRDAQPVSPLAPTHEIEKQSQMAIAQDSSVMEIASTIASMYDDLTTILVTHYAEIRPSPEFILFGSTTEGAPLKIDLPKCNFDRDPWVVGTVTAPPPENALRAIRDWMAATSTLNLKRPWVVHPKPCFISMDGLDIQQQLVAHEKMSHAICTSIFRRLAQLDMCFSKDTPGMIWRKYIEPDFATIVLSNADPLTVHSIRTSFQEGTASCNPTSCRMWFIPAILPDGWVVYAFDMLRKRIIVYDPAVGQFGYSNHRVSMHEFVSNKLHAALFNCLYSFFSSWHCESTHWTRTFPIIMREQFHNNYDGDKLQIPLTKETLVSHINLMLYKLMRTQGNQTKDASDSLKAIKGSFVVL
ncbi:hypothetical protein VPH35_064531 [Triticum aestivum]